MTNELRKAAQAFESYCLGYTHSKLKVSVANNTTHERRMKYRATGCAYSA